MDDDVKRESLERIDEQSAVLTDGCIIQVDNFFEGDIRRCGAFGRVSWLHATRADATAHRLVHNKVGCWWTANQCATSLDTMEYSLITNATVKKPPTSPVFQRWVSLPPLPYPTVNRLL